MSDAGRDAPLAAEKPRVFLRAGQHFQAQLEYGEAERCLARAFRLDRRDGAIARNLSELYRMTDRPKDALHVLDLSLREGSQDQQAAFDAGMLAFRERQFQASLTYLERYESQAGVVPWVNYYRSISLFELGQYERALVCVNAEREVTETDGWHLDVVEAQVAPLARPAPATLLGTGKVEEIAVLARALEPEVIIVNAHLTPVQQRDPMSIYHPMSVAALSELAPAMHWADYFRAAGVKAMLATRPYIDPDRIGIWGAVLLTLGRLLQGIGVGGEWGGSVLLGLFSIALAGTGLLTTVGVIVSMDTFGPVSDNAQGIAEMSKDVHGEGAAVLTRLDAVGNTTKAITKGIAIATAVLAATALFGSFRDAVSTLDQLSAATGNFQSVPILLFLPPEV